ncbi:hypothetical protein BgiBS90_025809, partial [Biomphalaria glabrata]
VRLSDAEISAIVLGSVGILIAIPSLILCICIVSGCYGVRGEKFKMRCNQCCRNSV